MAQIKDIHNKEYKVDCMACEIQSRKINLPIERITETKNFVVEQDLEIPIEGFLVIVSKNHIKSFDQLNQEEILELMLLIKKTRKIMRKIVGAENITFVQEENTKTSHFHIWLFPWHDWMLKNWNGKLSEITDIMEFAKKNMRSSVNLNKISDSAKKLKEEF